MQGRLAVAVRPPKRYFLILQLWIFLWSEYDGSALTCFQFHFLRELDVADGSEKGSADGLLRSSVMLKRLASPVSDLDRNRHRRKPVRYLALNQRVAQSHSFGLLDPHIVPYSNITSSYGRHPVPAHGGMECRVVSTKLASVEIRTLGVLFLHGGVMCRFDDVHGNDIILTFDQVRDVETGSLEGTSDVACIFSIDIDISFPIYSVEGQNQ